MRLMKEEKGDGSGAGGGTSTPDGGGAKEGAAQGDPQMLLRGLAVIAQGMTKLQESNEGLLNLLKEQAAKGGSGEKPAAEGGGAIAGTLFAGADLEQLDRPQFAALLLSKFEERMAHHLKEVVKPFEEKIGQVSNRLEDDLANREVNKVAGEKKDFYEWRQEIGEIVKANPNLSVTDAYILARNKNSDKSKAMDKKYEEKKPEGTGGFVGFSPTGGGGRGEGAGRMKFNEAAERAYNDVLASLGGVSLDQLPVVGRKH